MEQDRTTPDKKSYKEKSTLPEDIVERINRQFAYNQQSKLVAVAARHATDHIVLAKRNRAENLKRRDEV